MVSMPLKASAGIELNRLPVDTEAIVETKSDVPREDLGVLLDVMQQQQPQVH